MNATKIEPYMSEDYILVKNILLEMGASFRSIEKRGEYHYKGWIINSDSVGVGWVIFERGIYSSLRFHRSIYEFNKKELELRIENMQLKRSLEYHKKEHYSVHDKLVMLREKITVLVAE
jgi:hypothetical protein